MKALLATLAALAGGWLLINLVGALLVGAIARGLLPGKDKVGWFMTIVIGFLGGILGKIVANGTPVGENATVEMKCGKRTYPAVKTDKSGSYHVVVEETGKCTLTVSWNKQSASLDLASYDDAVQADLVLEVKDGKLTVRRK